jgi:lysophospholipid hydrolase
MADSLSSSFVQSQTSETAVSALSRTMSSIVPAAAMATESLAAAMTEAAQKSINLTNQEPESSTWLGLVVRFLFFLLRILPSIFYWIVKTVTMVLPTWLFHIASMTLTVTMNATTL